MGIDLSKFKKRKLVFNEERTMFYQGEMTFPDDVLRLNPDVTEEELLEYQESIEEDCGWGELMDMIKMEETESDYDCSMEVEEI